MEREFRVHWLSASIWGNAEHALELWSIWFKNFLGPMKQIGHGGRGFRSLSKALLEAKLYADPITVTSSASEQFFSFEFPGSACDTIPDKVIQEFILVLYLAEKARITRLDLAWDDVGFTPGQVKQAVEEGSIRSYLRRKTMAYTISPYEIREDGQLGSHSLRLGSNQSGRMLRVYDKHGPVRLELQTRHERADLVARDVLRKSPDQWIAPALAHLRDYVDFVDPENGALLPWWESFVNGVQRAGKVISDARELVLEYKLAWFDKQVSPTYSLLLDIFGQEVLDALASSGRKRRGKKYDVLLSYAEDKKFGVDPGGEYDA